MHRRLKAVGLFLAALCLVAAGAWADCKPITIVPGCFTNDAPTAWTKVSADVSALDGTRRAKWSTDGTSETVAVSLNSGPPAVQTAHQVRLRYIGSENHLLLMTQASAAAEFHVLVVDFSTARDGKSTPTLNLIAPTGSFAMPHVHVSPRTGSAFSLINFSDAKTIGGSAIWRSDDGALLCEGPFEIDATPTPLANFGDGLLRYSSGTSCGPPFSGGCPLHKATYSVASPFPPTVVGIPSTSVVRIANDGRDCLQISRIDDAGPFHVTTPLPVTIAKGSSAPITVQFTPTASGPIPGTLPVTGIEGESLDPIPLTATAHNAVPNTTVAADGSFSSTLLTDDADDVVPFHIDSTGDGPVLIDSVTISDTSHFTVVDDPSGGTAPPRKKFRVKFHPGSTSGTFSATLTVKATSVLSPPPPVPPPPHSVTLTAVTHERVPHLECVDGEPDFGVLSLNTFNDLVIRIANSGTKVLTLKSAPTISEKAGNIVFDFKAPGPTADPLLPGDPPRELHIRFFSIFAGPYTGQVKIESDDPDGTKVCTFKVFGYTRTQRPLPPCFINPFPGPSDPLCVPALSPAALWLLMSILALLGAILATRGRVQ